MFNQITRTEDVKYTALTPNERGFDNAYEANASKIFITAKNIPGTKINGNSDTHNSSYTILNLCLPIAKEKKTVLDFKLDLAGIACSSGSACQSGSSKPSHVLSEILSNSEMEKISLRFSFSKFNSLEEVDYVVTFLKDFINDN